MEHRSIVCHGRAWAAAVVVMAALFVPPSTPAGPSSSPPANLVFPSPPANARIRYVGSIADNADYVRSTGWWHRTVDRIAGPKEIQKLVRPYGIDAVDGALYVCDPDAGVVHVYRDKPRGYVRIPERGRLGSPVGVAAGARDEVCVTDSRTGDVLFFDGHGRLVREGAVHMRRPTGVAWSHARDRIYVADTAAHRVLILSARGDSLGVIGRPGAGDGEFNFPTAVWIDAKGEVLVTDAMNFRVQAFDADGHFRFRFGQLGDGPGNLSRPKGVAADTEGHIYVVDALFDAVQVFDREGRLLLTFGSAGNQPGQFWLPTGIAIDGQDRIYVADSYNHRVQVFQYLKEGGEVR